MDMMLIPIITYYISAMPDPFDINTSDSFLADNPQVFPNAYLSTHKVGALTDAGFCHDLFHLVV
ncbi:MAG: hypothetical protein LAT56_14660, partial [Wenzhouxiangella sp.]|nr:hypothetical protein [Wenzhouxiangella sp.]